MSRKRGLQKKQKNQKFVYDSVRGTKVLTTNNNFQKFSLISVLFFFLIEFQTA